MEIIVFIVRHSQVNVCFFKTLELQKQLTVFVILFLRFLSSRISYFLLKYSLFH